MIFRITRTSMWGDYKDKPPYENAKWNEVTEIKRYRILDENGKIMFQETPYTTGFWTIKIESIEDLIQLSKELGEDLVLSTNKNIAEIEIYDTYRE